MSSDLDAHYAVARRVAFQVEEQLQELETGRDTSAALQGNISTNLNQLAREITLLEGLLAEETSMARSGVWRRKVRQLAETSAGLREALEKFATRNFKTQREAEERRELLQRRNAAGHTAIEVDAIARETRGLDQSSGAVDDLLGHASSVLENLSSQRLTLSASRRKLVAIFDQLGLSNSLLRLIERRELMDRLLVWGGMAAILLLLYLLRSWRLQANAGDSDARLPPADGASVAAAFAAGEGSNSLAVE